MFRARLLRAAAFFCLLCIQATLAHARAGGGGGYSPSGGGGGGGSSWSSSGGGGGGSGGGGDLGPVELVLMLAVIGFVLYSAYAQQKNEVAARRARLKRARGLAARLGRRDPHFTLEGFERHVGSAFQKIQEAWSQQDLSRVRGFMSDGLHERFSIQLREQAALGYRNRMSNVRIHELTLVEARAHEHFDVACVRIDASAADDRIDLAKGRAIDGTRRDERFVEVWSFLRASGATTAEGGEGLLEGQCPNCAAPVDPERIWACESCGAKLETAPPDWVLTEITQLSEWRTTEPEDTPGLKVATERDPGLTRQQLEDRASVLFWRLMDARRVARTDELTSVARASFLDQEAGRIRASARRYLGDCAVGSVAVVGLIAGTEWDLALVEIRWAGGEFERRGRGAPRETGRRRLRRSLLVMARRAGVESPVGRCIGSAHCGRCGAPDEGRLDGDCGFCGEPLDDGRDWLIDRFLDLGEDEARMLLHEARHGGGDALPTFSRPDGADAASAPPEPERPFEPGGREIFAWCLQLIYADQQLAHRERLALEELAHRLGIPGTLRRELQRAAQFDRLEIEPPSDREQAARWLEILADLAQADGRLDRRERSLLADLERRAGVA